MNPDATPMLTWFRNIFINKNLTTHEKDLRINSITIDSVSNDTDWIRIVPVGDFPNHPMGPHTITRDHIKQMAANFNSSGGELLFDYDHGSVFRRDSKAAGWSPEVDAREDGLYIKYPEFTNSAQQSIDQREYRFFSPVYFLNDTDKNGKKIGARIHSVGVTNTPYMDVEIDHIGNSHLPGGKEVENKNYDNRTDMKLSKENLAKLGLNEAATEEEINTAIANSAIAAEKEGTSDKLAPGKVETIETETAPEKGAGGAEASDKENERIAALEARLAKREQEELAEKAEMLVNSAVDAGKILPRDKDAYLNSANADYAKTKTILDGLKANSVVPGSVKVNTDAGGGEKPVNKSQAFRDYIKPKMAIAD